MTNSLFSSVANAGLVILASGDLAKTLGQEFSKAVKSLLETKHLYQSASVDLKSLTKECCAKHQLSAGDAAAVEERVAKSRPRPGPVTSSEKQRVAVNGSRFEEIETPVWAAPDIKVFCVGDCGRVEPFHPISANTIDAETHALSYACQSCRAQTYTFLLSTRNGRVTLVGRNPMERVEVPKVLPKTVAKHFSGAKIAHQAGQTLAGIFLLRVFCEQWAREHAPEGAFADQAIEAYMATLPIPLKQNFPSLKAIYSELSGAVHRADANSALFEKAASDIEDHFDARKVFKLPATASKAPPSA